MPNSAARLAVVEKPKSEPALAPAAEVVVLKFGSSILKDQSCAPAVASEVYGHVRAGRKVIAVVSALGGHTDRLLADARELERQTRAGAEDYADEVFGHVEQSLDTLITSVRRCRDRLNNQGIGR